MRIPSRLRRGGRRRRTLPFRTKAAAPIRVLLLSIANMTDVLFGGFVPLVKIGPEGLSLSLVVGHALRFRRPGLLGRKGQDDQGDDVGQHIVHAAGKVQRLPGKSKPVYTLPRARNRPKTRAASAMRVGFHWPKIITASARKPEAGHAVFKLPLADAGGDVDHAAQSAQDAGDQDARVAHLIDVDAHAVSRLGMLAAGQPQAEAGLVERHIGQDQGGQGPAP